MKTIKTDTRDLECTLTVEEVAQAGREAATAWADVVQEEIAQTVQKHEMKARLDKLKGRHCELSSRVQRGTELRPVTVEIKADFETGQATEIRLDTAEIIRERPLTEEERQLSLGFQVESLLDDVKGDDGTAGAA